MNKLIPLAGAALVVALAGCSSARPSPAPAPTVTVTAPASPRPSQSPAPPVQQPAPATPAQQPAPAADPVGILKGMGAVPLTGSTRDDYGDRMASGVFLGASGWSGKIVQQTVNVYTGKDTAAYAGLTERLNPGDQGAETGVIEIPASRAVIITWATASKPAWVITPQAIAQRVHGQLA